MTFFFGNDVNYLVLPFLAEQENVINSQQDVERAASAGVPGAADDAVSLMSFPEVDDDS